MPQKGFVCSRRRFLKTVAGAGLAGATPWFIPAHALGKSGAIAPSERITLGGIGIRHRGEYVLRYMLDQPDVQFLAVCDVRADRRQAVKTLVDAKYGNHDCDTYRDFRELLERPDIDAVLIATGDRWHAIASIYAAKAGKDIYCEKPCAMTIELAGALDDAIRRYGRVFQAGTQRRNIANFVHAVHLARSGKLGKLHTLHASIYVLQERHDWLPAEPEPPKDELDWDLWLGPAPWRPYNRQYVDGGWRGHFDFDSGARLLDWGAHTVDLCQWANQADDTTLIEFEPAGENRIVGRYANGVKLILRNTGWLGLGTCPVRFEGDEGWIETGDSGRIVVEPPSLQLAQIRPLDSGSADEVERVWGPGISPRCHVRDFLDCVKSRALPASNARATRKTHVACHAAYIAWLLKRKVSFDPLKEEFIGDDEANLMRSRALREPWHI